MEITENFNKINNTSPLSEERHDLIIKLVENYRDNRILPFLTKKIKEEKIEDLDATLVFACGDYSYEESIAYFDLFVDIVINSHYEAAWTACALLSNMRDYYDKAGYSKLMEARMKLIQALPAAGEKTELIKDVIFYCEEYLGLIPDKEEEESA